MSLLRSGWAGIWIAHNQSLCSFLTPVFQIKTQICTGYGMFQTRLLIHDSVVLNPGIKPRSLSLQVDSYQLNDEGNQFTLNASMMGTRRKQASTDQACWTPVQSFLDYMPLVSNCNPKVSMGTNPRDQQTSLLFKMFSKLLIKLFKIFHLLNPLCIYEIFLKHSFFFLSGGNTLQWIWSITGFLKMHSKDLWKFNPFFSMQFMLSEICF